MKPDNDLSLEQQIVQIQRIGESHVLSLMIVVGASMFVACSALFFYLDDQNVRVFLLFFAGVGAMVAAAVLATAPRFRKAARATRTGRRVKGEILLDVDDSDSEHVAYRGLFTDSVYAWQLRFCAPMGWSPQPGTHACELVFIAGDKIPALAVLDSGILIPTSKTVRTYSRRS